MTQHPAALQLRLLQTVVEVAAEKNSTLVLPFPVELLRFLERATPPEAVPVRAEAGGDMPQAPSLASAGPNATQASAGLERPWAAVLSGTSAADGRSR
jgi:hypothetical protein